MRNIKLILGALALSVPLAMQAQYAPAPVVPVRPAAFLLGTAHVDGLYDHDDIKVGRFEGRYHSIMLTVRSAPIQFDHVVIHYGNGMAEPLPVHVAIPTNGSSSWIVLPGRRDRVIQSLELWYSRADPRNPYKPEVELYGAP
jgi:hypothetical protein